MNNEEPIAQTGGPLACDAHPLIATAMAVFDRTDGFNRRRGPNLLGVENDHQAVEAFFQLFADSPHTLAAYKKEIGRFLLWAAVERRKSLTEINRQDILAYEAFLAQPEPADVWIGPRAPHRLRDGSPNPEWRPFTKPVKPGSRAYAMRVLNRLFAMLVKGNYLEGNPVALIEGRKRRTRRNRREEANPVDTVLDPALEQSIWETLEELAREAKTPERRRAVARLRFAVAMGIYLGARIGEIARDQYTGKEPSSWRLNHVWRSFCRDEEGWWWLVFSKGLTAEDEPDRVPVRESMLEEIERWRVAQGLPADIVGDDWVPLLPSPRGGLLSTRQLDSEFSFLTNRAAARYEEIDPRRQKTLAAASFHWLRHTYVDRLWKRNSNDPRLVQLLARHEDIKTTLRYTHTTARAMQAAVAAI